jgi:integrase
MSSHPNKFPFTDLRIRRLKPEEKRRCFYDAKCPGLELRVSPTGYRAFFFVTQGGRRYRLGQFPPLTVKLAREVANEKRVCLELGISEVQRESLGDVWAKYRENMIERDCRPTSVQLFERCFRGLAHWKRRRLDRITYDMVKELVDRIRARGQFGRAKNTLRLLSAIFNFASRRGWVGRSPVQGIAYPKVRTRTRFVEPHELHGFIATLEERKDVFGDLILVALFTGARRSEVQEARWEDVDLERRCWTFVGKGETWRSVYFSDYVFEIFRRRRRESPLNAPYIFENPFTERPLGWVRRVMYRAEMVGRGLPIDTPYLSVKNQFSMHVLRHSFITYGFQAGIPMQVLQKMVGHSVDRRITVAVYGHSTEEWEREGFQKVADLIRQVAKANPKATGCVRVEAPMLPPRETGPRHRTDRLLVAEKTAYVNYFRDRYLRETAAAKKERINSTKRAKQKVAEEIFALHRAGKSFRMIAHLLSLRGHQITHEAVWNILHNRTAAGAAIGPGSEREEQ